MHRGAIILFTFQLFGKQPKLPNGPPGSLKGEQDLNLDLTRIWTWISRRIWAWISRRIWTLKSLQVPLEGLILGFPVGQNLGTPTNIEKLVNWNSCPHGIWTIWSETIWSLIRDSDYLTLIWFELHGPPALSKREQIWPGCANICLFAVY